MRVDAAGLFMIEFSWLSGWKMIVGDGALWKMLWWVVSSSAVAHAILSSSV